MWSPAWWSSSAESAEDGTARGRWTVIEPKEKALTLDPQEVAALARERLFAGVPDEDVKLALEELERLAALPPEKREETLRAYLAQEEVEL